MRNEFTKFKKLNLFSYIFYSFIALFLSCSKNERLINNNNVLDINPIILISMDGFRWDYLSKTKTPNFDELIKNGALSKGLIPPFPSKTFPSHITLVTGRYPKNHGIISNNMYDPIFNEYYYIGENSKPVIDGKWYEAEPIWVTVEKQGLKAMTMFWPASEAQIMGVRPTEYFVYDGSIIHNNRIDQILSWLDYPINKRGQFFSLYFSHTDDIGHRFGPDSDNIINAIIEMDRSIGRLISGLKDRALLNKINLIITTDHGMSKISQDSVIFLDDYINMDNVEVVDWGPAGSIRPKIDIDSIYFKLKNAHPKMNVYKQHEIPDYLHYNNHRRIQPITIIADEHWTFTTTSFFNKDNNKLKFNGGTHGYDPKYESMMGIFLGHGPAFKTGYYGPTISNIHLYEMMCLILDIKPSFNDGSLDSTLIFLSN